MRVNLECGTDIRNNCLNINSWPSLQQNSNLPDGTEFAIGDFKKLDPIVENNSVDQLIFNPAINSLTPADVTSVLEHWRLKLRNNGILKTHLIDIKKVSYAIYKGQIGLQDADQLVFGPNHTFNVLIDSSIFINVLKNLGFNILSVNISGFYTVIEASKNG